MVKKCFHCGNNILFNAIKFKDKYFCCIGCKIVYNLISSHGMENYYEMDKNPGIKPEVYEKDYKYLDEDSFFNKIVEYHDDNMVVISLIIPSIHCISCIWLLHNLKDLNSNIVFSNVDYINKKLTICYYKSEKLSNIVNFLNLIGYSPNINLGKISFEKTNNSLILKLVVAGFCFGNIMLLSFPEYFEFINNNDDLWIEKNKWFFRYIMLIISLPVFFYSASDYFKSFFNALKSKFFNIDVPISTGIIIMFLKTVYDIYYNVSSGYVDSMCGLVFFMLLGKWFQNKKLHNLSFEVDYKELFPISVLKLNSNKYVDCILSSIRKGDKVIYKNRDIICFDSILNSENAMIDSSFITGESKIINKKKGDIIFAGSINLGSPIKCDVVSLLDSSYMSKLWTRCYKTKQIEKINILVNKISKKFSLIILLIAALSFLYWVKYDINKSIDIFVSILIISCPCALTLTSPIILGYANIFFFKDFFFVKNTSVIELLSGITDIIFDKTGTLTKTSHYVVNYIGYDLTNEEKKFVKTITSNSNHPLSISIKNFFSKIEVDYLNISNFREYIGQGMSCYIDNHFIELGSYDFFSKKYNCSFNKEKETSILLYIDGIYKGKYIFSSYFRKGIIQMLNNLVINNYKVHILSGDINIQDFLYIRKNVSDSIKINFNNSPLDKLEYIKKIKNKPNTLTLMIGDGINDIGAMKESDISISIINNGFHPSCDAFIKGDKLNQILKYLFISKKVIFYMKICFLISFFYNIIGIYLAIIGKMHPVYAAILMPLSSMSVLLYGSIFFLYIKRFNK